MSTDNTTHTTTPADSILEVQDLAYRYGKRWVLAHIQFSLNQGQGLMITGPNGSGKTTLLRCLSTATQYHHGEILMEGAPLWTQRFLWRPHLTYLGHHTALYGSLTVQENLSLWSRLIQSQASLDSVLEQVGLKDEAHVLASSLSAGMQRRLAIGRVLLKKTKLLCLDEPFAAIDRKGCDTIIELVNTLRAEGTMVCIATHLPEMAQRCCDQSLSLERGRMATGAQ